MVDKEKPQRRKQDKELHTLSKVVALFEDLGPEPTERCLDYLNKRFGDDDARDSYAPPPGSDAGFE